MSFSLKLTYSRCLALCTRIAEYQKSLTEQSTPFRMLWLHQSYWTENSGALLYNAKNHDPGSHVHQQVEACNKSTRQLSGLGKSAKILVQTRILNQLWQHYADRKFFVYGKNFQSKYNWILRFDTRFRITPEIQKHGKNWKIQKKISFKNYKRVEYENLNNLNIL